MKPFNRTSTSTAKSHAGPSLPEFVTVGQVASALKVSPDYVRRLLRDGFLTGIKMPGEAKKTPIRIAKASVDAFIERHAVTATTPPEKPRKRGRRKPYHGVFTK